MVSDAEKRRVGALIRDRRQELGLSGKAFAALVGVSRNAVSNWERGRAFPQRYEGKIKAVLAPFSFDDAVPDPNKQEIRDLAARLELGPEDLNEWIRVYEKSRRRPAPDGERERATV